MTNNKEKQERKPIYSERKNYILFVTKNVSERRPGYETI